MHVTNRRRFPSVLATIAVIQESIRQSGFHDSSHLQVGQVFQAHSAETSLPGFAWKQPPYEYVYDKLPIEILCGNVWLPEAIVNLTPLSQIQERMRAELVGWI